jgi:RHS repeat-associated protein
VAWGPPTDNGGAPILSYSVTPITSGVSGTTLAIGTAVTRVSVIGLTGGASYTFSVTAKNAWGIGAPATSSTITISIPPAAGNPFNSLTVSVGYAQNNPGGPLGSVPTPWQGSSNVNFIGSVGSFGWDTGAIRIDNSSATALTINDVLVTIGSKTFDLWGSAIAVPADATTILTQMGDQTFDTSDVNNPSCAPTGIVPTIRVSIGATAFTYTDANRVLNTGGYDRANCTGQSEWQQWQPIDSGGPSASELAGAGPIDEHSCNCDTGGLTVNGGTGNFWHADADLLIPGRVPLSFIRTYNALLAGQDGPLGFGWTDSDNAFLTADQNGDISMHEENGGTITFFPLPNGGYSAPTRVLAALASNGDGSFTLTRHDKSQLNFNPLGDLTTETNRLGYPTTFAYDTTDRLVSITDWGGRILRIAYGTNGRISTVTDVYGSRLLSFLYDTRGNLQQVTDVAGGFTQFSYDGNHLLQTVTDPNRGVLSNTYDVAARVTLLTDPQQFRTQFNYTGNQTTITDPNGNATAETYQNGECTARTNGLGTAPAATWSYVYDPATLGVAQTTDPKGHVWSNTWDTHGNLLQATDPLMRTTTYTYNSFNEVLTAQDPLLVTTTYAYDGSGNLLSKSRPTGTGQTATVGYGYTGYPGDATTMTDANGKVWRYGYDQFGNRTSVMDPMSDLTTYTYDWDGRVLKETSPKGNAQALPLINYATVYTFDPIGDVKTVTDPLGNQTQYSYDGDRNRIQATDANGHTTTNTYNLDNQLIQVQRADGSIVKTTYDGSGNLRSQVDGLNNTNTYSYDALNRKVSSTDADLRTMTYSYDAASNLLTVIDPMNRTTTYGYDVANQLRTITYSDGITPNASFTYDADGQRLTMSDGTGQTSYSYDTRHRLTQSTNGAGQSVRYGYDLAGHLTTLTYPGGTSVVTRGYDPAGRLSTITDWLNHTTTLAYDVNSNLVTEAYPNGVTATNTYDAADRLMAITDTGATPPIAFVERRDKVGQLMSENTSAYGYDPNNRVTSSTAGPSITYGYDFGDNLTQIGSGHSLAYDPAHQLLSDTQPAGPVSLLKTTYAYDSDGNRIRRTDPSNVITQYSWDQADRLISAGATTTYAYNGDGLRTTKTLSGSAEAFVYDVAEGLPHFVKDGATSYVAGPDGLPLAQINGSTVYYYHRDQLGSTRALTDSGGNTVATYTYDAFGNVLAATGNVVNPVQFAGQYVDAETGFSQMQTRYYDPASGQFISRDPLTAATRQPYSYVADNPLNATDPTGLFGVADLLHPIGLVAGGLAGLVGGAHDYLIGAQSDLDAGLGGDYGRGLAGVGKSFAVASVFVGVGGLVRGGISLLAAEDASMGMSFTDSQVQSQLAQHGGDFGFKGANNVAGRLDYISRLVDHVDAPGTTRIVGTYRGEGAIHYVNPETGLNLFTTPQRGFWAAWQLGPEQVENVILRGSLQ